MFAAAHARALSATGRKREALDRFRAAVQRWPADASLYHELAVVARELGAAAEALRAEEASLAIAPHNPLGPVNTMASAHVAMATPNFVSLEVLADDVPWRDAMLREPIRIEAGTLVLSDAPGLGIEIDLATCRAHPPTASKYPSFRQADGAVAEW